MPAAAGTNSIRRISTRSKKREIVAALDKEVAASGFAATKTWGPTIEDRESQITYSALGQQAPLDAKKTWDPDFSKRMKIKAALDRDLPDFSVRLGGTTSIDITLPGIDKAYGIRKLRDILAIPIDDMLYVGRRLVSRRKRCSGAGDRSRLHPGQGPQRIQARDRDRYRMRELKGGS